LWLDANASWGPFGRVKHLTHELLSKKVVLGIESPLPHHDIQSYRRLAGEAPLRIAVPIEEWKALMFVRESLADTFVCDDQSFGRSLAAKASLAAFCGARLWLTSRWNAGVVEAFQRHLAAAYPAVEYLVTTTTALAGSLPQGAAPLRDGECASPRGPGLGVHLDEDFLARHRRA
jgi:L-alanine-DL-glutamate epimerase-like enolase superfamily enzyme